MQVFNVQGMTCGHCANAVQREDATAQVTVDLAQKQVSVKSELPSEQILELIREEGYEARAI
jgi:copper chaperone